MAKLLHADLVAPAAAIGSSEDGVRSPHGKKRVAVPVIPGQPYALAKGRAAADAE
jgi:hypothetical protein